MVAKVPDSCHSIVREHTGILKSGDKLRHHNTGLCIPRKKNLFELSCLCIQWDFKQELQWWKVEPNRSDLNLPHTQPLCQEMCLSDKMWAHRKTMFTFEAKPQLRMPWITTAFPFISCNLAYRKPHQSAKTENLNGIFLYQRIYLNFPRSKKMTNLFRPVLLASAKSFTSTVPQSHSSPGSSRALPQLGPAAMVLMELGLDKQLGWARSMNSASCSKLQPLKNSGNAWFPVLKRSKEISALQKTQWTFWDSHLR